MDEKELRPCDKTNCVHYAISYYNGYWLFNGYPKVFKEYIKINALSARKHEQGFTGDQLHICANCVHFQRYDFFIEAK